MGTPRVSLVIAVLLFSALACKAINLRLPSPRPQLLLNEILFQPAADQSQFVELKNVGGTTRLDDLSLQNEAGESYAFPVGAQIKSSEILLIVFDGQNKVEGDTIHAERTEFLNSDSGFINLLASDGTVLDHVAWGETQPESVNLSRGGIVRDLVPGTTIGRVPSLINVDAADWVTFGPSQATPGAPNSYPSVEAMLPLNGAIFKSGSVAVSWYPVAGAAEYRFQLSSHESFSPLYIDQTVTTPGFQAGALAAQTYYWRVQAIAADGSTAAFSPTGVFIVTRASTQQSTPRVAQPAVTRRALNVPLLSQHKDTSMLLLESKNETGAHSWDKAHPKLDPDDPADNQNCSLASIAMVNAFFGGTLSQDRIGYEVYKDTLPGPEMDLNYGRALRVRQVTQAITFALGAAPTPPAIKTPEALWADVVKEIDANRPVIAANLNHVVVITGYSEAEGKRTISVNDPWVGIYDVELGTPLNPNLESPLDMDWLLPAAQQPASDEPEISQDSDGDGVVDFDETQRFGTDPNDADSDKDNVKDKNDIRASIFDRKHGYAFGHREGRDFDGDGLKMELDEDSDGGHCFDGLEDYNLDGIYKKPETYNFDKKDDACFWGTDEVLLEETRADDDGTEHQRLDTYVTFSLRAVGQGKLEGLAQVKFSHTGEFFSDICTTTYDMGTQLYQAILKGEFSKLPDGTTQVHFAATPNQGPDYVPQWITNCPSTPESQPGWTWDGGGGLLRDGVYDYFADMSSSLNGTGEFWQKIHLEQAGNP